MEKNSTPFNICLIDDDKIYQFTSKKIIEMMNFKGNVLSFFNGKEAVDYLKKNQLEQAALPDVIFLDVNMPVMDGWEFLEEFEGLNANMSKKSIIYMVTSSMLHQDRSKSQNYAHVKDFIIKPMSRQMLEEVINTTCISA